MAIPTETVPSAVADPRPRRPPGPDNATRAEPSTATPISVSVRSGSTGVRWGTSTPTAEPTTFSTEPAAESADPAGPRAEVTPCSAATASSVAVTSSRSTRYERVSVPWIRASPATVTPTSTRRSDVPADAVAPAAAPTPTPRRRSRVIRVRSPASARVTVPPTRADHIPTEPRSVPDQVVPRSRSEGSPVAAWVPPSLADTRRCSAACRRTAAASSPNRSARLCRSRRCRCCHSRRKRSASRPCQPERARVPSMRDAERRRESEARPSWPARSSRAATSAPIRAMGPTVRNGSAWVTGDRSPLTTGSIRVRSPGPTPDQSSPSTRAALSRRNLGHTSSLSGTSGSSDMMRS